MTLEIVTFIIGFLGILLMIWQLNHQLNQRFDSFSSELREVETSLRHEIKEVETNLRTEIKEVETNLRNEFKADLNTMEIKLNTLLMGLFRSYPYENPPRKQDQS
ncbi:MAG TPA: hypothetical protein P5556_09595 [Candidatus Gastranaerophilales bacterium]|nr:hypothetical protein [Candidatus Gastranaerophilales bacterium]